MAEFEDIIQKLGAFGRYQIRVFIFVSLSETPCAWFMVLAFFTQAVPKIYCPVPPGIQSYKKDNVSDVLIGENVSVTNATESYCQNDSTICPNFYYGNEFTSIVTEWNLLCGQDYIPSMIMTLQMVGVLLGACITGQLADTFGRRKIYFSIYGLMLACTLCSAFAPTWEIYTVFKFLAGVFIGGTMVVNFVLPMEFIGPRWRTFCGCIGFWPFGIVTLAGLAYLIRDWKHLTYTVSLCGVPLLLTWWWVPESPRWLIQRGRIEEGKEILTQMAHTNKKPVPDFSGIISFIQKEKEQLQESKKYSYWDLFRTCNMSKNSLILIYAWFVSSAVYYGTNFNAKNLAGDKYLNFFVLGFVEYPAIIIVLLINNVIGRKKTMFAYFLVAGLSCLAILVVDLTGNLETWPELTTTLAMLGRSGVAGGWAVTIIFSAEIFPTVVRNIGVGACAMGARVGGVVAPQLVFLDKFAQFLPFTVFGALALLCSCLSIFLPETLNKPLPDSIPPRSYNYCWQSSVVPSHSEENGHVGTELSNHHKEIDGELTKDRL